MKRSSYTIKNKKSGEGLSVRRKISLLTEIKNRFDSESSSAKRAVIQTLSKSKLIKADLIESYHDSLCFLRAYPDNPQMLKVVEKGLRQFESLINHYKKNRRDNEADELADTGIIGTSLSHEFSYELTSALASWYGANVEIEWEIYVDKEDDTISGVLPILVAWQENDTLDNDLETATEAWLRIASARNDRSVLMTLLKLFSHSGLSRILQRYLYESAAIPVKWNLHKCPASRTLKRIPWRKIYFQSMPILGRTRDLRTRLKEKPTPLRLASKKEGGKYVDHIKDVLGVRCRELFPLMHSNPDEVYINEPGRGVQLVIYGNIMDIRLPLESNFGAMLVRNGMPIGYGIGCMFFDRVEIAINVFPAYRTGESSFVIEEFFRLFYHHFGARLFLVRSYQVGDDNDEALESGSFWFYYKLGFRPVKRDVRNLAAREYRKIVGDKTYRTPLRTLKRLSRSDIFFHIDEKLMRSFKELPLASLGYRVTEYVARHYDGKRDMAIEQSATAIARLLGLGNWRRWRPDEITALRRLAPLIACLPQVKSWSRKEKTDLGRLIRAKGGMREREYVRLSNEHPRFKKAIEQLAFGGPIRKRAKS